MSLENPGMYFDASCSWNGYNHQGKLAIWYALGRIEELYDSCIDESQFLIELKNYFLEIEFLEDFSFGRYLENGEAEYISVHQVKNHQMVNPAEYDSALLGLANHVRQRASIQNAFLHTTRKIDFGTLSFSEYLKALIKNPVNLQQILENIEKIRNDASELKKITEKKKGRPSSFRQKLIAAYAEEKGGDNVNIDDTNIMDALNALEKKTKEQIELNGTMTEEQLTKISEFPYVIEDETQTFCKIDQIESLLKAKITDLHRKLPICKSFWTTTEFVDKRYLYLLGQLDQHIVERNLNFPLYKSGDITRKIELSTIYEWLVDPIIEAVSEQFYLYYIKEAFLNIINRYCADRCQMSTEECQSCAIHSCTNKIGCLSFEEMKSFLHLTNPTVTEKMSMITYASFVNDNGIRNPFIRGLIKIPIGFEIEETAITYKDKNTLSHVLTTIVSDDDGEDIPFICSDILKNRDLFELMMDCDCFISRDVETDSIQAEALECGYQYDKNDEEHIARFKNVRIERLTDFINCVSKGDL